MEKGLKCIFTKFELFIRLAVFEILQFKVNNFRPTSVLPFFQYCDRSFNVWKADLNLLEKNLIYNSDPFTLF